MRQKGPSELILMCHPLPLNHVEASFKVGREMIEIVCTVETTAQTGVEMEALPGVSVAALTLYDMCKAVDKNMRIEGIRVVQKIKDENRAHHHQRPWLPPLGVYTDLSGPEIEKVLGEFFGDAVTFESAIVPDEIDLISATLKRFADELKCDLVVTTGGTGIAVRDVTPEATRPILEKELPGFGEIMRVQSFAT